MKNSQVYYLYGQPYNSLLAVSKVVGIPYSTLNKAVKKDSLTSLDALVEELNPILKKKGEVKYNKKTYLSLQHLCTDHGVSSYKLWLEIKKAGNYDDWMFSFEYLYAGVKMEKPVNNRTGSYPTVYAFCDANMFDKDFFQYLIYKGLDFDSCCTVVSQFNIYRKSYGDVQVESVKDLASALNTDIFSIMRDLYDGRTISVGVKQKINLSKYSPVYKKVTYKDMKELLSTLKVTAKELKDKLSQGYTFSVALDKILASKYRYTIRTRRHNSLDELAKDFGVPINRLRKAVTKSSTIDQALIMATRKNVAMKLFYEEISLERYAKVLGVKESTALNYISTRGSIYQDLTYWLSRESDTIFIPVNNEMVSLQDVSEKLNRPVQFVYFYWRELGSVDVLYKFLESYNPTKFTNFDAFGHKFKDFEDFKSHFIGDYNPSMDIYNSFEDLVLRYVIFDNYGTRRKSVTYNGLTYESISDFASNLDLNATSVSRYLSNGHSPEETVKALSNLSERQDWKKYLELNVYHKGVYFGKAVNLLQKTKIDEETFKDRVARKWSLYEAATVPISERVVYSGIFEGYHYESLKDLAKHLNIKWEALTYHFHQTGEDIEKAVAYVRRLNVQYVENVNKIHYTEGMRSKILYKGRLYNSLADIARLTKVPSRDLESLFLTGVDLDTAILHLRKQMIEKTGIRYNSSVYKDIYEWAKKERYDIDDVKRRKNAGQSDESIIQVLTTVSFSQVSAYDKIFDTVEEAAQYFKVDASELSRKLISRYTLQQMVEELRLAKYSSFTIEGDLFTSIKQASRALGVSHLTLHRELMRGRSLTSLLKALRLRAYAKGKLIPLDRARDFSPKFMIYHGELYTSLDDLAPVVNFSTDQLIKAIDIANSNKMTLDDVIDTPNI